MCKLTTICMSTLMCLGFSTQVVNAETWTYDFENAKKEIGTGHSHLELTLNGMRWTSFGMRAGNDGYDWKNGNCSARIYGEKMSMKEMPYMMMAEDKIGGIGTVSFSYKAYTTHEGSQVAWILQASKNGGEQWKTIGAAFTPSTEVQTFSADVNYKEGRIRIVRADYMDFDPAAAGTYQAAFNIDDLTITDCSADAPAEAEIVLDQAALDFGEINQGETSALTCDFSYQNLKDPINVAFKKQTSNFKVSVSEIAVNEYLAGNFDVTYCPQSAGSHSAEVILTSGNATTSLFLKGSAARQAGEFGFSGGSGTEQDPYLISTPSDFVELSANVDNKNNYEGEYFKMTQDIDMSSVDKFTPIGNNFGTDGASLRPFQGIFDGDGHKISNLTVSLTGKNHIGAGLFGITKNAIVRGVTIVNSSFTADAVVAAVVGVAIGGEISDCHVGENVSVNATLQAYAGGVVAASMDQGTKIRRCSNLAPVTSSMGTGGILGTSAAFGTKIECCINYADIDSRMDISGGILGYSEMTVTVMDCANIGNISTTQKAAAGIVGALSPQVPGPLTIYNCYNNGIISSGEEDYHMPITVAAMGAQQVNVENCYYNASLFTGVASYGTPVTADEMKSQDFVDKLNSESKTLFWVIQDGVNDGMPVPYGDKPSSIEDASVELPYVAVVDGKVVTAEGYTVARVFDMQGKSCHNEALNAGVYVALVYADSNPLKPMAVKVVNE